ncbi:TetR/AcrR family transcriptional regulator [Aeromicrobium sp. UC242_57]|uniref:TetR/AcrR family transcriptional regulator n=1 Tax=Aeromicrobium sp. UC242_57 TaxID=3374624 RepID=UPI0037A33763
MTTSEAVPPHESVIIRRQRRRSERRDRVYAAAIGLFTERGYEGTTMDDIAVRADVARTSVFNYFERKSAFLDDWAARRRALAFAGVTDGNAPLADRLAQFMTVLAETSTTHETRPSRCSAPLFVS